MADRLAARKALEEALGAYIVAEYGADHWLGDYVIAASVIDMNPGAVPEATQLLHLGAGAYHSQRGLVEEASDWLIDLKLEEREDTE